MSNEKQTSPEIDDTKPQRGSLSGGTPCSVLPQVQVFMYEPTLYHSVWYDQMPTRHRTIETLESSLIRRVKNKEIIGYRFVTIHKSQLGIPSKRSGCGRNGGCISYTAPPSSRALNPSNSKPSRASGRNQNDTK